MEGALPVKIVKNWRSGTNPEILVRVARNISHMAGDGRRFYDFASVAKASAKKRFRHCGQRKDLLPLNRTG